MATVTNILDKQQAGTVQSEESKVFTTSTNAPDEKAHLEDVVDERLESEMREVADSQTPSASESESVESFLDEDDEEPNESVTTGGDDMLENDEAETVDAGSVEPAYGLMHVVGSGLKMTARKLRPRGIVMSVLFLPWKVTSYGLEGVGALVEAGGDVRSTRDALKLFLRAPVRLGVRLASLLRPVSREAHA